MAKTGSERTKEWRAARVKDGFQQKGLLLSPQAVSDMAKAKRRFGCKTDAETVTLALSKLLELPSNLTPEEPVKPRKRGIKAR